MNVAITKAELIEKLKEYPDDALVLYKFRGLDNCADVVDVKYDNGFIVLIPVDDID